MQVALGIMAITARIRGLDYSANSCLHVAPVVNPGQVRLPQE